MVNNGFSFGWSFPGWQVVALVVWGWCVYRGIKDKKSRWGWWLMALGGGLNLVERLVWGRVIDYLKVPGLPIYNNVNDWLIVGGLIYLIWKLR